MEIQFPIREHVVACGLSLSHLQRTTVARKGCVELHTRPLASTSSLRMGRVHRLIQQPGNWHRALQQSATAGFYELVLVVHGLNFILNRCSGAKAKSAHFIDQGVHSSMLLVKRLGVKFANRIRASRATTWGPEAVRDASFLLNLKC